MKEKLQKKLQELLKGLEEAKNGYEQAKANVNAFNGAIQIVQQLLQEEQSAEQIGQGQQVPIEAPKKSKVLTVVPASAKTE